MPSILFVCLGNICRSPLAEGVFRAVLDERGIDDVSVDSAGTGGWHAGEGPDPRSVAVALRHGVDIGGQRARKVRPADFGSFDLVLGMDRANVRDLKALAPAAAQDKIHLYLDYATGRGGDVPDPYYDGEEAFTQVYRMIREASEKLADKVVGLRTSAVSGQASSTM